MSNPILTSDLYKDDGAIEEAIKQLKTLSGEYTSFIDQVKAQSAQLEVSVKQSNVSTVSQREELKKVVGQVDELEKQYSKYVELLDDNAVKIAALKTAQQKLSKVNKLEATIASSRNGSMEQLNAQLKLNKIRLDQLTKAGKANTAEGFKLNAQTERLTVQIKNQKDEQRKAIKVRELERKAAESQIGSYDQLSAQYSLLKIRLNALSEEERFNTAEGKKMQEQSAAIYAEMDRLQRLTGKHTLNVGNYTNSIVSAFNRQTELTKQLKKTREEFKKLPKSIQSSEKAQKELSEATDELTLEIQQLSEITGKSQKQLESFEETNENLLDSISDLPGALGDAGGGVQDLSGNFKKLLANPVVLVIGLIVAGLYALFNAFKASEKGTQFMTKATGILNGLWSVTIGFVDTLADGLISLFEDPQQALKDFGNLILENIINRFKAVAKLGGIVGKAIGKLLKGDFDGLKESAKEAASAMVQFSTGLDEAQQDAFVESIKETTKEVLKQAEAFGDLETAKRNIANANRKIQKSVEDLATKEQLLLTIADDNTKSFKEREEAAEAARKATESRSKKEIQIARNNLSLINTELDLRRANGEAVDALLDQQLSAYQQLAGAEREYSLAVRDNEKTRDELKQDRLERDLDILIDGFDNQKTINEKLIADETKTFDERRKLLERTKSLSDDSFDKQIETIQKFTGIQLDANELINESDAVVLNQKIRSLGLSEIIEGRLLEIVRDRKSANQDLAESEQDLNAAELKNRQEKLEAEKQMAIDLFDVNQELKESEFALTESTEKEKTDFRLNAEKDRLLKILELNEKFGGDLTDLQKKIIQNQVKAIENELDKVVDGGFNIYDKLGFNLTDDQQQAISDSLSFATNEVFKAAEARTKAAEQNVQNADNEVQSAEAALSAEIALAELGFANNVETAQKELALAKKNQREALRERAKAQKAELALQTIEQSSNLITASSKIWATLGFPFAIPAIALMWSSFIAAKAQAFKLAKSPRSKGGLDIIGNGSHASGNDTYLGYSDSVGAVHAERGEAHMTLKKSTTRKYKNILPQLFNSLDKGTFMTDFSNQMNYSNDIPIFSNNVSTNIDLSGTEERLDMLVDQGNEKFFRDGNGNLIRQYKNLTQRYV